MASAKKLIVIIVVAMIAVFVVLYNYSFPKQVDMVQQAVIFKNDDGTSIKTTSVTIKGTMHRPLFKDRYFKGEFRIDGFPFTYNSDSTNLFIDKHKNGVNNGMLHYTTYSNVNGQSHHDVFTAPIFFADNFETFNIIANDDWFDKSTQEVHFIVSGGSLEEARLIQTMQAEKLGIEWGLTQIFRN
ncbi:hypothetical protein ACFSTH_08565 [Paenibacillus yanchengensis]|uniref:Uncharacterized protein n=1 Tax=Paenibacillus yanchengensis TaxID=2035833 RepID=A0ABW4YKQ1_9BACL